MTRLVYRVSISARIPLAWMPAFAGMTLAAAMAGRPKLFTPQIAPDAVAGVRDDLGYRVG